ncbi:hypothetical protein KIN20_013580 [Parelaphostrongylus tenuis]|uniref:Uncharacterized protein n=1 Tax=Parelaphostrongylus tenuis TaxID=148309 RepID=A0AAD5N284_PARTN|nr:hypothetical protein KIN20_013580 [Parelaphostrongylus tenuis]
MKRVASAYHHINYIPKHRPLCFPISINWQFHRWKILSHLTETYDVFTQLFILSVNPDTIFRQRPHRVKDPPKHLKKPEKIKGQPRRRHPRIGAECRFCCYLVDDLPQTI